MSFLPTLRETKSRRRSFASQRYKCLIDFHSVAGGLCHLSSLSTPPCLPVCVTVGETVWPAVTDVLYCRFHPWKHGERTEKKCRLVLHMSALFLELLRSWPHYTDLHTRSPSVSLSVCLFKLIAECRWALLLIYLFSSAATSRPTAQGVYSVCVCERATVCVCESCWPRGWEGSDRGLDMLKRQSKWVFLKQWRKYHRFMPGQFMSPYLFLKHVTLAAAEW